MKKIKVLQFPMANAYGGITQYALQNWRYIDKARFQFDFATLSKTKLYFEDEAEAQGCKVFYISCYAEENEEQFKNEIRAILANGYDVVHLHTSYWKSFLVEELAREARIPKIIIHSHNTSVLEADNRKERIAHHRQCVGNLQESLATDYWACSEKAARWLYGNRIPKEKIIIQKNAIDVDSFSYKPDIAMKIREEFGWKDKYVIGHVGRFCYQKNHVFLLKVFKAVYGMNQDTRLLLIGTGPERPQIDRMISDWGLEDCIIILEKRNDVNQLMQAIDCFVLPSHFEGLGIVLIEAQTAGCDCLISKAIPEEAILTDYVQRLPLVEKQWINNILELSKAKSLKHQENPEKVSQSGYDIKEQIKKIEEGYLGLSNTNN